VVGVSLLRNTSLCDWVNGFRHFKDRDASVLKVIEGLLGLRIPFLWGMTLASLSSLFPTGIDVAVSSCQRTEM